MTQRTEKIQKNFEEGDIVRITNLMNKSEWNGKLATIAGPFDKDKNRWPIEINFGDKSNALLRTKNLILHQKNIKNINVIEIQSNRDGFGPLHNKLRNLPFSQKGLTKYIKNRRLKEYKSEFARLLKYDLSIFVNPNTFDTENNAGSVFLTCDLSTGLSPHGQLKGNSIVVCNNKNKKITTDRLWGILNFIFQSMDYYDDKTQRKNILNKILIDAKAYKEKKWIPNTETLEGDVKIDIYNDSVKKCQLNGF